MLKILPTIPQGNKHRVIIPVSGSVSASSVSGSVPPTNLTLPASALPPGVLSNTQPGSVVMIPAHYMSQVIGGGVWGVMCSPIYVFIFFLV